MLASPRGSADAAPGHAAPLDPHLFDEAPVAMWLAEPGMDGAITDVNDAACRLFGRTREELLTASKPDLFAHDDPRIPTGPLPPGAQRSYLRTVVLPDGSRRPVIVDVRITDGDRPRALSWFTDGTALESASTGLREALAFSEAVLNVIPDPIHVADADEGRHVWATKQLGRQLGYTDEQLAAMDPEGRDLIHPDDIDLLTDSVRRVAAAADGEVVRVRHRVVAADGRIHWLDRRKTPFRRASDGTVEQYVSVLRDVTDEVEALEAERDQLRFREAVLAATPDIISVYDIEAGQTVWASRSLAEVLGYSVEHIRARQAHGLTTLMDDESAAGFTAGMERMRVAEDGTVDETVVRVRHADGTWRLVARRSTPFRRDADGRVVQLLNVARDVTDATEQAEALARAHAFQQAVIATTPDFVLILDAEDCSPIWASRDLSDLLGWTLDELATRGPAPLRGLAHPDDASGLAAMEQAARDAPDGTVVDARYRARDRRGTWHWLLRRMMPFERAPDGTVRTLLVVVRDVTEAVESEAMLAHAALHDPLTALPNRRLIADRLRTALAALDRGGRLGVLFVDLDEFKRINDVHGHAIGDAVLQEVAHRLVRTVRPGDTVGRMGGDEFVIVLATLTDDVTPAQVEDAAQRVRHAVAEPIALLGTEHRVTASVGVIVAGAHGDADTVLRDADTAMYAAKRAGKDRVAQFDPASRTEAVQRSAMERALHEVLVSGEVQVHFQPIRRLLSDRVDSFECLLRLPDPADGFFDTQEVIEVAEATGLILEVGAHVLAAAVREAVRWPADTRVAVNLSAREIAHPALHSRVSSALAAMGLPAERLILEITESVLLDAAHSTMTDLRRLRDDGVGIAIDDFGTGYASLRYLAELPVSILKIDRSFTRGIGHDRICDSLVAAMIGLARELRIDCVVEGVETVEQLDLIGTEEHVLAQGYLVGRPAAEARG